MNFLPLLRELVSSYQAFERFSAPHIKRMKLTPSQFDVIATLGNQPPITCKELGDKTLITKGTLTGVLDRLESKELISRFANSEDGRSQVVALTQEGKKLFEQVFPNHLNHLNQAFGQLSIQEIINLQESLRRLRGAFEQLK